MLSKEFILNEFTIFIRFLNEESDLIIIKIELIGYNHS